MAEEFVASTQYGDYKGTIAVDYDDNVSPDFLELLRSRSSMPAGYTPVGLRSSSVPNPTRSMIPVEVVAFKDQEVGESEAELASYQSKHGSIPVYPFPCEITAEELFGWMKRLRVCVKSKRVADFNLMVHVD